MSLCPVSLRVNVPRLTLAVKFIFQEPFFFCWTLQIIDFVQWLFKGEALYNIAISVMIYLCTVRNLNCRKYCANTLKCDVNTYLCWEQYIALNFSNARKESARHDSIYLSYISWLNFQNFLVKYVPALTPALTKLDTRSIDTASCMMSHMSLVLPAHGMSGMRISLLVFLKSARSLIYARLVMSPFMLNNQETMPNNTKSIADFSRQYGKRSTVQKCSKSKVCARLSWFFFFEQQTRPPKSLILVFFNETEIPGQ